MKKENAITLIALIITIIVMLILASVVINLTLGENGLFTTAKYAVKNYTNAQDMEIAELNEFNNTILAILDKEENSGNGEGGTDNKDDMIATDIENAQNYGRAVNYNITVNSTVLDNWKLFYIDKESQDIFLIYGDYLNSILFPTSSELRVFNVTGKYFATQWGDPNDSTKPAFQPGWATNKTLFKAIKYNLNSSYNSSKCASTLLNTDNWTSFVNNNFADLAIGSPTVEMWVESWNEKGYKNIELTTDNLGYEISESSFGVDLSTDEGYNDEMFFPYKEMMGGADGYWIASPYSNAYYPGDAVMLVSGGGLGYNGYNYAYYAIRPVIHLKSNMTLKWNSTTKSYDIVNK